jgi:hypothetical protein
MFTPAFRNQVCQRMIALAHNIHLHAQLAPLLREYGIPEANMLS